MTAAEIVNRITRLDEPTQLAFLHLMNRLRWTETGAAVNQAMALFWKEVARGNPSRPWLRGAVSRRNGSMKPLDSDWLP